MRAASAVREAIGAVLGTWLAGKRIRGFEVLSVRDQEDIVEYDLDADALHEAADGTFPFVWVNVTFDSGTFDTSTLAPIEQAHGLKLLVEFHR